MLGFGHRFLPWIFGEGEWKLIPKGTPIGLLADLETAAAPEEKLKHQEKVLNLLLKMKLDLASLPPGASDEEANKKFANLLPGLLELSKCPDYVVNRGRYFGTSYFQEEPGLSDDDKRALIEYIETRSSCRRNGARSEETRLFCDGMVPGLKHHRA